MSKFSNEYHQLSKEYVECKKELFHSFGLLSIFAVTPFIFRFLAAGEDYIFNIYKGDFISVIDFFSILGVVVSPFFLLKCTKELDRIKKELKTLKI